jgi:hydrogenase small subunit
MRVSENGFLAELQQRGVSRRQFMSFCGAMAAAFSMPRSVGARIAQAIEDNVKPTLVWLEFQDCAGNTESFLRAAHPSTSEIILDLLSVDYHETIMAAAGHQAEANLQRVVSEKAGEYIAIVEGSIPTGANGAYCTIGGRSALQIAREVCGEAAVTIAIGTCAAYGGIPAAAPNPTGALSVADAVPGVDNLVNLPACPANAENLAALIVYWLTFRRLPPMDPWRRPMFAYAKTIHDACERRAHYDAGQYVERWGDEGHRLGYCLFKQGCKGPVTSQNCPNIRWNEGTNWPIGCGHPCIGCAEPDFWDQMTPFYRHLDGVPGFGVQSDIDRVGIWATAGVAAAFAAHGVVSLARRWKEVEGAEEAESREGEES